METFWQKSRSWLVDRLHLDGTIQVLSTKSVPNHRYTFWYLFGGLSLFFFVIQILTGILLLAYYNPSSNGAHESVRRIISEVPYGWLIRSVHVWSSHLMIATIILHMTSAFFMRAYRKPREIMWVGGVVQLIFILGFGFTGYLLPWDMTAYFATQIGTEIPKSIPVVGEFIVRLLRGGDYVDDNSLHRFFALHVVILPLITIGIISLHLILSQVKGTSTPDGMKTDRKEIPFFPNFLIRDLMAWTIAFILLFGFALLAPVKLGAKAEPFTSAPLGIKPEWYFLPLYQTLRIVPANILGISGETIVNTIVGLFFMILFLIPFIDTSETVNSRSNFFRILGIVVLIYLSIAVILAYTT